jgi:thioredoxin 1
MSENDSIEDIREQKKRELQTEDGPGGSGAEAPAEPIHVSGTDDLTQATEQYDVVLVDFYADWCGPCKMLEPTIETLAADTDAAVAKVDVDANQQLARQYQVRGVPTLALFADGELVEQTAGLQDEETLRSLIGQYQ